MTRVIQWAPGFRPQPKPKRPTRSASYLDFVRAKPCCVCGTCPPCEPHHFGPRGMSQKTDDYRCVPLCQHDHRFFHDHSALPEMDADQTRAFLHSVQVDLMVEYLREREGT